MGTLILPTLYSVVWFGVFGSEAIRTQRIADSTGLCTAAYAGDTSLCVAKGNVRSSKCANYAAQYSAQQKKDSGMGFTPSCVLDSGYHTGYGKCDEYAWTRLVQVANVCVESTSWVNIPCGYHPDPTAGAVPTTGACVGQITAANLASTFNKFPLRQRPACFVPASDATVCLYNAGTTDILFDQLSAYGPRGFTDTLAVFFLVALFLYFITSSDSGSLVIDMICSNGDEDPSLWSRALWSFVEGLTACALLYSGKNLPNSEGSLRALQSASILCGLPYTFILFYCCQALVLACKEECGELSVNRPGFPTFFFSAESLKLLLQAFFLPGWKMGQIIKEVSATSAKAGDWPGPPEHLDKIWGVVFQLGYLVALTCVCCAAVFYGWCIIGLCIFIGLSTMLGFLRYQVRTFLNVQHGDLLTDIICGFIWPFAIAQMWLGLERGRCDDPIKDDRPSQQEQGWATPVSPKGESHRSNMSHTPVTVVQVRQRTTPSDGSQLESLRETAYERRDRDESVHEVAAPGF